MSKRKIIRLTESDLHNIIKEVVRRMVALPDGRVVDIDELPHKNQYFDLTNVNPRDLDEYYVMYEPHTSSISHTHPLNKVITNEDVKKNREFLEKANYAKKVMCSSFPLYKDFFTVKPGFNDMYAALLICPKLNNLSIIKRYMSRLGFFIAQEKDVDSIYDKDGREWVSIRFEPCPSNDLTEYIFDHYSYLYHLAPRVFEERILSQGLIPSNHNSEFKYNEDRVYMMSGDVTTDYLQALADTLYKQASQGNIPDLRPDYVLFSIDLSKLDDDIRFYGDINEEKGLFITRPIPANALKKVCDIKASEKKPKINVVQTDNTNNI